MLGRCVTRAAQLAARCAHTAVCRKKVTLAANGHYPVNANGQSYGSTAHLSAETYSGPMDYEALMRLEPDLVLSEGRDGTVGYVLNTELRPPPPTSPAEAISLNGTGGGRDISLFKADGVTVIGSFHLD